MKRTNPFLLAWYAFWGSLAVFVTGVALAAVIDRSAPIGAEVKVDGQLVATVRDKPVIINLPGDDVRLVPPAIPGTQPSTAPSTQPTTPDPPPATQPTTKPSDPIENAIEYKIRRGDPMPGRFLGGTAAKPIVVGFECGGVWNGTLHLRDSYVEYRWFGTGNAPQFNAKLGIRAYSNTRGITLRGLDFRGSNYALADKDRAFDGHATDNVRDLLVEDCWFRDFKEGGSIHSKKYIGDLDANYWQNITFRRCRFMDQKGTGERDGNGFFFANCNGITFYECFFDNSGRNKSKVSVYVHHLYGQAGNRGARVERCLLGWGESFACQLRGPTWVAGTSVADPGPIIKDNIAVDTAIGFLANGPFVSVTGNVVSKPHFHTDKKLPDRSTGLGGFVIHAKAGALKGNTRVLYGSPQPNTKTQYKMPAFDVSPRKPNPTAKETWWIDDRGNAVQQADNVDSPAPVDLSDLITRARAGEPIGKLVDEGHARVKAVR